MLYCWYEFGIALTSQCHLNEHCRVGIKAAKNTEMSLGLKLGLSFSIQDPNASVTLRLINAMRLEKAVIALATDPQDPGG